MIEAAVIIAILGVAIFVAGIGVGVRMRQTYVCHKCGQIDEEQRRIDDDYRRLR